jgi:NTP pyrophosphatase (non-canonical NTP hydrolase)
MPEQNSWNPDPWNPTEADLEKAQEALKELSNFDLRDMTAEDVAKARYEITRLEFNGLSKKIGQWAKAKGFRSDWLLADQLDIAPGESKEAALRTESADALRINIVGMKLMLIVTELGEALESLRDTGVQYQPMGIPHLTGEGNFGEEIADAIIRLLDLSDMVGIDIGEEVVKKVAKNNDRPHKHGRKV